MLNHCILKADSAGDRIELPLCPLQTNIPRFIIIIIMMICALLHCAQ